MSKYEPKIPNRPHDAIIEWGDDRKDHIWHIWYKERILSADRNIEDGGGRGAWNFKEENKKLLHQNNKYGDWGEACNHPMGKLLLDKYIDYIVENELLEVQ